MINKNASIILITSWIPIYIFFPIYEREGCFNINLVKLGCVKKKRKLISATMNKNFRYFDIGKNSNEYEGKTYYFRGNQ